MECVERVSKGLPLAEGVLPATPELVQEERTASVPTSAMILYFFIIEFVVVFVFLKWLLLQDAFIPVYPAPDSYPQKKHKKISHPSDSRVEARAGEKFPLIPLGMLTIHFPAIRHASS